MYAGPRMALPFSQGFPAEPAADELLRRFPPDFPNVGPHVGNLVQTSVLEYDLGGEGDLFKAPEPIIEDPLLGLDPLTAAISMMSGNEDMITTETIKNVEMDSMQNEDPLSEAFYECQKELLAKAGIDSSVSELPSIKTPPVPNEGSSVIEGNKLEGPLQKSVSSECLRSMEWIKGCNLNPNFLDFQGLDLGDAFRLRRAYSDGDIQVTKTLGVENSYLGTRSVVHSSLTIGNLKIDEKIEERRQKLSRYRKKKSKRNFGRKIKYACRKVLADSQPRVHGRFAKSEDCDAPKPYK